jgi:hypothetical protein
MILSLRGVQTVTADTKFWCDIEADRCPLLHRRNRLHHIVYPRRHPPQHDGADDQIRGAAVVIELDLATVDFIVDAMIGTMTIMAVFSLAALVWALKPARREPRRFDWSQVGYTDGPTIIAATTAMAERRSRPLQRKGAEAP